MKLIEKIKIYTQIILGIYRLLFFMFFYSLFMLQ